MQVCGNVRCARSVLCDGVRDAQLVCVSPGERCEHEDFEKVR